MRSRDLVGQTRLGIFGQGSWWLRGTLRGTEHGSWLDFMHILPETGRLVLDDPKIVEEFISSHDDGMHLPRR